jgi:predicted DNA-binding protein YlxM (UPF0122 family)
MAKNKGGRPLEMTDEKIKKLEEAFALDCSIAEACFYADISKVTYYNRIERKPELLNRFEALRQKPVLLARQTVVKAVKDNPDIALKYLERKRKNEFSTRQEIDQTQKNFDLQTTPEEQEEIKRVIKDNL